MGQVFGTVGRLQLIETKTLTVAGATFDFTGLSGQKRYMIVGEVENDTANQAFISMYLNNDTTATNYYSQVLIANAAGISSIRNNNAAIGIMGAAAISPAFFSCMIQKNIDNYVQYATISNMFQGATLQNRQFMVSKTGTIAEITQITISAAENMKIGSKVSLYEVSE